MMPMTERITLHIAARNANHATDAPGSIWIRHATDLRSRPLQCDVCGRNMRACWMHSGGAHACYDCVILVTP